MTSQSHRYEVRVQGGFLFRFLSSGRRVVGRGGSRSPDSNAGVSTVASRLAGIEFEAEVGFSVDVSVDDFSSVQIST